VPVIGRSDRRRGQAHGSCRGNRFGATECTAIDHSGAEVTFNSASPGSSTPVAVDGSSLELSARWPSASQCAAVDNTGHEITFDPTSPGTPTPAAIDGPQRLNGVSCPSPAQCIAVDATSHVVTFDPTMLGSPTAQLIGAERQLESVACVSTSWFTVVDSAGFELSFDQSCVGSQRRVRSARETSSPWCRAQLFISARSWTRRERRGLKQPGYVSGHRCDRHAGDAIAAGLTSCASSSVRSG
jgi:hypothetical protein